MPLGSVGSHQLENPIWCTLVPASVREWRAVVRPRELTHEHSCAVLENHRAEKKRTLINHFRMPNPNPAAARRNLALARKKTRKLSKKTIANRQQEARKAEREAELACELAARGSCDDAVTSAVVASTSAAAPLEEEE